MEIQHFGVIHFFIIILFSKNELVKNVEEKKM